MCAQCSICSAVLSGVDNVGCRYVPLSVSNGSISEVNCVSSNTCIFSTQLLLPTYPPRPHKELYVYVQYICICVCLHSDKLLHCVVFTCRNVIELGAVEGWFE